MKYMDNDTITNRRAMEGYFWEIYQTPKKCNISNTQKNVTYIFQVGKSDLVILYSNHPKNVTYIFEVYLYKFDL